MLTLIRPLRCDAKHGKIKMDSNLRWNDEPKIKPASLA